MAQTPSRGSGSVTTPNMPWWRWALLFIAPIAVVLYVVPLILFGVLSDLFHFLTPWRSSLGCDLPWYMRLGGRLHMAGRDFMVWSRETDRDDDAEKVPYLHRHYVTGRRLAGLFSVCLHRFHLSDEDWLHDHPWPYVTIILGGGYWEHMPSGKKVWRGPGSVLIRSSRSAHMVELDPRRGQVWTLFIMGPRLREREWGFRTDRGWVHWNQYLDLRDKVSLRPVKPGAPGLRRPTQASVDRTDTITRNHERLRWHATGPGIPLFGLN